MPESPPSSSPVAPDPAAPPELAAAPAESHPIPPAEQPAGPTRSAETHAFEFHGSAREYFRLWIVNTLLTLVTCGIFSAWAKVRKRRYFRGNTRLLGHAFDYRADPRRLLIGNVVVAVAFLTYGVVGQVYPWVRIFAFVVGVLLLPWVVIRSLAFNAHNTAYRGLRFAYRQTYGMAAMTYLAQAVVVVVTAGLYYPAWIRNRREFTIGSHRLGDAFFRFEGKPGPFYVAYLLGGAVMGGALVAGGIVTAALVAAHGSKVPSLGELLPFFALYGFAFFVAKHLIYALLFNHVWNHTRLDRHRFVGTLRVQQWLGLQLGNLFAILGTAGLLYPWAAVRSARYALSCLHFQPAGPIEEIERLGGTRGSAVGDTASEFVGIDFGL